MPSTQRFSRRAPPIPLSTQLIIMPFEVKASSGSQYAVVTTINPIEMVEFADSHDRQAPLTHVSMPSTPGTAVYKGSFIQWYPCGRALTNLHEGERLGRCTGRYGQINGYDQTLSFSFPPFTLYIHSICMQSSPRSSSFFLCSL